MAANATLDSRSSSFDVCPRIGRFCVLSGMFGGSWPERAMGKLTILVIHTAVSEMDS